MKHPLFAIQVSDLHCGSKVGLCPPEVELGSGNVVLHGSNLHQEWLWAVWQELTQRVIGLISGAPAILFVNGDATEGSHHRNGSDLIDADIQLHTTMAAECLKPLASKCQKIFVTKGTECHTLNMEDVLADLLKAEKRKALEKWLIEINGCLIDATHHMPTTTRAYLEAGAMSIVLGNSRVNAIRAGHQPAQIYLRGHRHCGGVFSDGAGMLAVTGAFQMLTRFGYKVVPDSIPRPSIIVLDWRGKKPGELPISHEFTSAPPQNEIVKL